MKCIICDNYSTEETCQKCSIIVNEFQNIQEDMTGYLDSCTYHDDFSFENESKRLVDFVTETFKRMSGISFEHFQITAYSLNQGLGRENLSQRLSKLKTLLKWNEVTKEIELEWEDLVHDIKKIDRILVSCKIDLEALRTRLKSTNKQNRKLYNALQNNICYLEIIIKRLINAKKCQINNPRKNISRPIGFGLPSANIEYTE